MYVEYFESIEDATERQKECDDYTTYICVDDELFCVCFPDLELLSDSQSLSKINNTEWIKMVNYHLLPILDIAPEDTIECHRFDIESLLYDHKLDFFLEFKETIQKSCIDSLVISSSSKRSSDMDNDLSNLFYETISTKIVVSSSKVIWCYNKGLWKSMTGDHFLWKILSTDFIKYLQENVSLIDCSRYLGSVTARKRIIEDVKLKLVYPNFEDKIDTNRSVIGVKNGTLDIDTGEFRASRISDLLSKSTNVEYYDYDMDYIRTQSLMRILKKVFPDKDLLRFFIRSCSTFLEGYNLKKVFYVWWGLGNNCKSGMTSLVRSALGDYCSIAPVSLITGNRARSSEATPELCHIEGKLVVFLQEPDPREQIKTGRIKELTGNDRIFVRNLFQYPREIDVKCKIVHVCNTPTAGPDTDSAFKKRVVVVKFTSMFLDQYDYSRRKEKNTLAENMFVAKENMEEKIKSLGDVFLTLMVKEYQVFKELGLQIPDIVRKDTEDFLTYKNFILKYIRRHLIRTADTEIEMSPNDIYESFKYWFRNMYPGYYVPNYESFVKELNDEGFTEDENGMITNISISDQNVCVNIS